MRWPNWWPLRRRPRCAPQSEAAKERAERELEQVRSRWPAVNRRAESLKAGRERNGFGEAMLELFREHH